MNEPTQDGEIPVYEEVPPTAKEAVDALHADYCACDEYTPEDCFYQAALAALVVQRGAMPPVKRLKCCGWNVHLHWRVEHKPGCEGVGHE